MQHEDRLIHFSTELFFPPFQLKAPVLQRLYYELSQLPGMGYDSIELGKQGPPRFHSKRGEKTQSLAIFLPDRVLMVEEWVDMPLSVFLDKTREVARRMIDAFEFEAYTAQTATVRSTFALTHFDDARVFLLDHVCSQSGRIGPHFQRPIMVGGIRFVLPHAPNIPGDLHVIIESYRHSRNEVFVEAKSVYSALHATASEVSALAENIEHTHGFIRNNIFNYLQQYDVNPEA